MNAGSAEDIRVIPARPRDVPAVRELLAAVEAADGVAAVGEVGLLELDALGSGSSRAEPGATSDADADADIVIPENPTRTGRETDVGSTPATVPASGEDPEPTQPASEPVLYVALLGDDVVGFARVADGSAELCVHPGVRRRGIGTALLRALEAAVRGESDAVGLAIWAHGTLPSAMAFARAQGLRPARELHLMSTTFPSEENRRTSDDASPDDARTGTGGPAGIGGSGAEGAAGAESPGTTADGVARAEEGSDPGEVNPPPERVTTPLSKGYVLRTFEGPADGPDGRAWVRANAEIFADHPEQGSLTVSDLAARMAQDWFDPTAFLLIEAPEGRPRAASAAADTAFPKARPQGDLPENGESAGRRAERSLRGTSRESTTVSGAKEDRPLPEIAAYAWLKDNELYVLGVHPRHQRRGLASALLDRVAREARRRGFGSLHLYVDGSNEAALRRYIASGYSIVSTDTQVTSRR